MLVKGDPVQYGSGRMCIVWFDVALSKCVDCSEIIAVQLKRQIRFFQQQVKRTGVFRNGR